jgi:hypothetical protein
MNRHRIFPVVVLVCLAVAAAVGGQELSREAIPDWPAPATWTPPRAHGVTTQSSGFPLPFLTVTPCRIADTRGNGFTGAYGPPSIGADTQRSFTTFGQCGIPAGALAVSFNFTALNVSAAGDLRVFPEGGAVPTVSTLNYNANTPNIANAAVVGLGINNAIRVQADATTIDLVIDVNGYYAGAPTGTFNTFLGAGAGFHTNGGDTNTAFGYAAFYVNVTGNGNTALGYQALASAGTSNNTAVGDCALCNATGSDNIGIGYSAGTSQGSGSHNIYIGNPGVNGESNTIRIGNAAFQDGGTIITGISGLGAPGGAPVYVTGGGRLGTTTVSSRRFKQDIRDIAGDSDRLMNLRPVAFKYKPEFDPAGQTQYGLIAEEVADVSPDLVTFDRGGRPEGVRYHLIAPLLLNEVQKQRRTIETQQAEIEALKARLAALEMRLSPEPRP